MDKEHIRQEMLRTAKTNGGKPLGQDRFRAETGIGNYDWGKYWSSFSDMVLDVGLKPNSLTSAYDNNDLLQKYVLLARDLGRIPGDRNILLKARNVAGFPYPAAFRRLGKKIEVVEQAAEYCRNSVGFEDVLQMCVAYLKKEGEPAGASVTDKNEKKGFVYLAKSGRFYKIGKSDDIGRRTGELKLQLPERTEMVHFFATDDPFGIEKYWQNRFESKRTNPHGEFFALDAADVRAFKRRRTFM